MSSPPEIWRKFWRRSEPAEDWSEDPNPAPADPELREIFVRTGLRVAAAFLLIVGMVYFAFWWSGSAVRFGADRAAGNAQPTWTVAGTVRNAVTNQPVPWASVE